MCVSFSAYSRRQVLVCRRSVFTDDCRCCPSLTKGGYGLQGMFIPLVPFPSASLSVVSPIIEVSPQDNALFLSLVICECLCVMRGNPITNNLIGFSPIPSLILGACVLKISNRAIVRFDITINWLFLTLYLEVFSWNFSPPPRPLAKV